MVNSRCWLKKSKTTPPKTANISSISVAAFEALWTDPEQPPTADALAWFELWIRRDDERWEAQLRQKFAAHNLEFPDLKLGLPEHVVIVVQATRETIESLPRSHRVAPGYFVWPLPPAGPTPKGESQKYHYASCLLRFRPKHRDMSPEEFRSRLDADGESSRDTFQDSGWAVGGTRRGKAGSLVQDVWKGSAGQLAEMGHLFQNGFTGR